MIVTLCIARRQFAADRGIATEQTHGAVIRSSLNQIAQNQLRPVPIVEPEVLEFQAAAVGNA
jgi:hypothetical protein